MFNNEWIVDRIKRKAYVKELEEESQHILSEIPQKDLAWLIGMVALSDMPEQWEKSGLSPQHATLCWVLLTRALVRECEKKIDDSMPDPNLN